MPAAWDSRLHQNGKVAGSGLDVGGIE